MKTHSYMCGKDIHDLLDGQAKMLGLLLGACSGGAIAAKADRERRLKNNQTVY